MTNTYSAVFEQESEWWIGYVEEMPGALAQERTLDDAHASLRQAVADIIQTNREMALGEMQPPLYGTSRAAPGARGSRRR